MCDFGCTIYGVARKSNLFHRKLMRFIMVMLFNGRSEIQCR